MQLIYDGFLRRHQINWIVQMMDEYSEVLEMSELPSNWSEWIKDNLIDHHISREDCMGRVYADKTKHYSIVRRDNPGEPFFIFFKSQQEKDAVIHDFYDLVVNRSPFKTVVEIK